MTYLLRLLSIVVLTFAAFPAVAITVSKQLDVNRSYTIAWTNALYAQFKSGATGKLTEIINGVAQSPTTVSAPGSKNFTNKVPATYTYQFSVCGVLLNSSTYTCRNDPVAPSIVVPHWAATFAGTDIGNPTPPGGSVLKTSTSITLTAGGSDIWGTQDAFHFVYTSLSGDGQITAKITANIERRHDWSKSGLMIRGSLAASASNAMIALRPIGFESFFQYRLNSSQQTQMTSGNSRYFNAPKWLKMRRTGNTVISYTSEDNLCWTERERVTLDLSQSAHYGIAATSHNTTNAAASSFSDISAGPLSASADINSSCANLNVDGQYPIPTQWIVAPAKFNGPDWQYTFSNPNHDSNGNDYINNCSDASWSELTDGPEYPPCIDRSTPPPWAQPTYDEANNWPSTKLGIGRNFKKDDFHGLNTAADSIWLRKEFELTSQSQIDNLMFWGRWNDKISIYINGNLASYNNSGAMSYRFLGIKRAARKSLKVGRNVIAVRIASFAWSSTDKFNAAKLPNHELFIDLGLTTNPKLANPPITESSPTPITSLPAETMNGGISSSAYFNMLANKMRDFVQEQGITGAIFGMQEGNSPSSVIASFSIGYKTPKLNASLPANAQVWVASSGKPIYMNVIWKLMQLDSEKTYALKKDTKYFAYLREKLGISLIPSTGAAGAGMNDITISHLLTHSAHVPPTVNAEEIAFLNKVPITQFTTKMYVDWIYGQSTFKTPGSQAEYQSNDVLLLAFLADRYLHKYHQKSVDQFISQSLNMPGTVASHWNASSRSANEPGYFLADPWYERGPLIDGYLAMSFTANSLLAFGLNHPFGFKLLNGLAEPEFNDGVSIPRWKQGDNGHSGAFDGTTSQVRGHYNKKRSMIHVTTMYGDFRELGTYFMQKFEQPSCSWGQITNPRNNVGGEFYIQNYWKPDQYLTHQDSNRSTSTNTLRSAPIDNAEWLGAIWRITQGGTATRFKIASDWNGLYEIYVDPTTRKLKLGRNPQVPALAKEWLIDWVSPENTNRWRFRIRSAFDQSLVINNELQLQENENYPVYGVQASQGQNYWASSQWMFCPKEAL